MNCSSSLLTSICALVTGFVLSAQTGPPALFEGSGYETGTVSGALSNRPGRAAASDLDGDGWPELVSVDTSVDGVRLRFGGPQLSFSDPILLGSGFPFDAVELFDFDGDGFGDIVALDANQPAGIHVFLGDATRTFSSLAVQDTGGDGTDLSLGDLDGDGLTDVAVSFADLGTVNVFLGIGGGQLSLGVAYTGVVGSSRIELRDMDGDGFLDAVTANAGASSISVLRGDGAGGFGSPMQSPAVSPDHLDLGDLDGDGDLDVLSSGGLSKAFRSSQNTAGILSPWGITPLGAPVGSIALGHLDTDGVLDVAIGYTDQGATAISFAEVATLTGTGDGLFQVHSVIGQSSSGDQTTEMLLHDMDQDGALDLLATLQSRYHIAIYRGLGDGGVIQNEVVHQAFGPQDVTLADFNGDGLEDLVVANNGFLPGVRFVELALATGPGTFDSGTSIAFGADVVVAADMNEDGALDVVYLDRALSDLWCVSLGDGAGGLGVPSCRNIGIGKDHMRVVDMDGDGHLDLVGYRRASDILVVHGDGLGGFSGPTQTTPVAGKIGGIDVVDLDGDGFFDVVAVDEDNDLFCLFLNDGAGGLGTKIDIDPGLGLGGDVVVFDADRDGQLDLLAEGQGLGINTDLVVLRGLGNLSFGSALTYRAGALSEIQAVDVDRDGWTDLVSRDFDSLVVIRADGLGGFRPREFYSGGVSTDGFALSDQNQDGWLDLFFANTLSTRIQAHYGKAPDFARAAERNGSGTNPLIFTSTSVPSLGLDWTSQVSALGFPSATSSLVVIYDRGLAGLPTPYGEILVAFAPPGVLLDAQLQPLVGGVADHSVAVPTDVALIGLRASSQAILLGAGPTLCNAIDLVFGL